MCQLLDHCASIVDEIDRLILKICCYFAFCFNLWAWFYLHWCASITCRKNRCRKEMITFFLASKFLASLFLRLWNWQDYYIVREWHFHPWVVGCFHSLRVAGTGMSFLGQLKANSVSHLDVTAFHSMLVHFMLTVFYFIDRFHKTCQSPQKWRRPRLLSTFPCLQMRRYFL